MPNHNPPATAGTTTPEPAMTRLDTFLLTLMLACVPALLAVAFGA